LVHGAQCCSPDVQQSLIYIKRYYQILAKNC
jgi:hypothetical protein